jgi:hypothetical protein
MSEKKERFEALARKIAPIIHADQQKNGKLKPSYTSPKFWVYIQREIRQLEEKEAPKSE